ncbi:Hypothetical_protein [Hexamita inflata]|uniref:Hypothetical_protein n=1 Tax=Hexamita inflata TaxID=28002 RepID=A0AA86QK62_9EUKA|nr:Hypothetical protein HINF_LOCUS43553 [Hexamita inflata]
MYKDFNVAYCYYKSYSQFQLELYEQLDVEIDNIVQNGLKQVEAIYAKQLLLFVKLNCKELKEQIALLYEYLKTEYRKASKQFNMFGDYIKQTRDQQDLVEQLKKEEDIAQQKKLLLQKQPKTKQFRIDISLNSKILRHEQLYRLNNSSNLSQSDKVQLAKYRNQRMIDKKQQIEHQIDEIINSNVHDSVQIFRAFEIQSNQITYSNPITMTAFSKDKEQVAKLRSQRIQSAKQKNDHKDTYEAYQQKNYKQTQKENTYLFRKQLLDQQNMSLIEQKSQELQQKQINNLLNKQQLEQSRNQKMLQIEINNFKKQNEGEILAILRQKAVPNNEIKSRPVSCIQRSTQKQIVQPKCYEDILIENELKIQKEKEKNSQLKLQIQRMFK